VEHKAIVTGFSGTWPASAIHKNEIKTAILVIIQEIPITDPIVSIILFSGLAPFSLMNRTPLIAVMSSKFIRCEAAAA
jgi:hypothetical protein